MVRDLAHRSGVSGVERRTIGLRIGRVARASASISACSRGDARDARRCAFSIAATAVRLLSHPSVR